MSLVVMLASAPAVTAAATAPAAGAKARTVAAAAARRRAAPAAATAAPREVSDAPFWSGKPTAPAFGRIEKDRVARARRAIDRMLAATTPRTTENTLQPYD